MAREREKKIQELGGKNGRNKERGERGSGEAKEREREKDTRRVEVCAERNETF